jgi:hypothetical protein
MHTIIVSNSARNKYPKQEIKFEVRVRKIVLLNISWFRKAKIRVNGKKRAKFALEQAMKARRGGGVEA